MRIYWDSVKKRKLILERGIDPDLVADVIYNKEYIDILEHPQKPDQELFIIYLYDYIHAVPYIIDKNGDICIKTAYPSRKYQKLYGRNRNEH